MGIQDARERYDIPSDAKPQRCKGSDCGMTIWFVINNPSKPYKKIPVNEDGTPHWRSCVNASDFKKVKRHATNVGNRR